MICTDKDLGLSILQYDNLEINSNDKFIPVIIHNNPYGLVLLKSDNYYDWEFLTDESFEFFVENFTFVHYTNTKNTYGFLSNLYNLYFEADEECVLYWNLKYKIKE